jgi:serine/threonine protein kinase
MVVMKYIKDSSLKKALPNIVNDKWIVKLMKLCSIISGLKKIHEQKMIHCDFHHGNILNSKSHSKYTLSISDLGLCKPVENFQSSFSSKKNDIYGVLPFVAPEVLRGKPYTPSSDIYSFSMIMWEFVSGIPPFNDRAHDLQLSINICKGERPECIEDVPQYYTDLMKKCWDKDPLKRPDASEIENLIKYWCKNIARNDIDGIDDLNGKPKFIVEFYKADKTLKEKKTNISNKSHLQAYHTSRLLDFTIKLNEILDQEDQKIYGHRNDKKNESYETEVSQSIGNYYNILNIRNFEVNFILITYYLLFNTFNRGIKFYRR